MRIVAKPAAKERLDVAVSRDPDKRMTLEPC